MRPLLDVLTDAAFLKNSGLVSSFDEPECDLQSNRSSADDYGAPSFR